MLTFSGEHDWTTSQESNNLRVDILEIKRHPRFGRRATFDYDFALLKLKHPVDFASNPGIRTACMPKRFQYIGNLLISFKDLLNHLYLNTENYRSTCSRLGIRMGSH